MRSFALCSERHASYETISEKSVSFYNICIYLILNSSLNFLTNNCNLFLDLSVLLWILCHVLHTRAGNASYAAAGLALEKIFNLDFLFSQAKFSKYKMVC